MLKNSAELEAYISNIELGDEARRYVQAVRESPPARAVQGGARNCCYRFASRKMGCTVSAESHIEHSLLATCEFDEDVLEYWDQPESIHLAITDTRRRLTRVRYTPDCLVMRRDHVSVIEVKPRVRCEELCLKRPNDWHKDGSHFVFKPGVDFFANLGLRFEVLTDDDLPPVRTENHLLLLQARQATARPTLRLSTHVHRVLARLGCLTLASLAAACGLEDMTPLLGLIADRKMFFLVDVDRLSEPLGTRVALSETTLIECVEAANVLRLERAGVVSQDMCPSGAESMVMLSRWRHLNGDVDGSGVSRRTLSRWRKKFRESGNQAASLIPRTRYRGNRGSRLPAHEVDLLRKTVNNVMMTANAWSPYQGWGHYLVASHEAAQIRDAAEPQRPVSFPTYLKFVRSIPAEDFAGAREGRRGRNEAAPPSDPTVRGLAATRPFQRAHIDHYLLDLHVDLSEIPGEKLIERLWLTAMVDEYAGAVLGMHLSLLGPRRRSCTGVLRDCVRRHGRLPETLVVDHGKEFESVYFEACLARLGVHKQDRPPEDPRYGSSIERVFGVLKTELLLPLPGSTQNDTRSRAISSSHKGYRRALLRLVETYDLLDAYFFQHFNSYSRGSSLFSPISLVREGLALFSCSGVMKQADSAFMVETAIEIKRPLSFDRRRGVTHNGLWFCHPGLQSVLPRTKLEAREEPWDGNVLYVLAEGRWLCCTHGRSAPNQDISRPENICRALLVLECTDVVRKLKTERLMARQKLFPTNSSRHETSVADDLFKGTTDTHQSEADQRAPIRKLSAPAVGLRALPTSERRS
jgi:transposase InsO family protein